MNYVKRCKHKSENGDETHATVHGVEGDKTLCGKPTDNGMWWFVDDRLYSGRDISCGECRKQLNNINGALTENR